MLVVRRSQRGNGYAVGVVGLEYLKRALDRGLLEGGRRHCRSAGPVRAGARDVEVVIRTIGNAEPWPGGRGWGHYHWIHENFELAGAAVSDDFRSSLLSLSKFGRFSRSNFPAGSPTFFDPWSRFGQRRGAGGSLTDR